MPLNILGTMDLPKVDVRPEEYKEFLEGKMMGIGKEVNESCKFDFLDNTAKIKMDGPDVDADNKFVDDREQEWADSQYKSVEQWRRDRDKNPAAITEMAVTLILHKWLGDRFIVARASNYDDYRYGVDNILIDKETGAAVCGFDEVIRTLGHEDSPKKDSKIKETILAGGSNVKYGATIVEDEIKRQDLRSMPTFYLSLSKKELCNLLVDFKSSNTRTENEKNILIKLVDSLENQYEEAKKIATSHFLKKNLEKFAGSLEIIKNKINQ